MSKRRVVVTGMGMLGPVGNSVELTWQNLLKGISGVRPIRHFDVSAFSVRIGASVQGFDVTEYLSSKEARKMDAFIQYGIVAAKQAMDDAGLTPDLLSTMDLTRAGVMIGSGVGGIWQIEQTYQTYLESGPRRISPFFIPSVIINMISGHVSIMYGFRGPNVALVSACTTGTHNIGYAAREIMYGNADMMIAGGAEYGSSVLALGGFAAARALSTRNDEPEKACRPWDKDRDGFVLGDGAGVLVLEEYEHAVKRGAKIYAELAGFGVSADAYHMTLPEENGQGAYDAMQHALKDAGMAVDKVDYINAHATSTIAGDRLESLAIERCFGEHARKLAVSSTKSMTGHLLGAAGAVESIFSVLAIRDQVAPPTINLDHPDDDCRLDYVPHEARQMKIKVAMNNSFGFGGTNGTLIFKAV